MANELNNAVKSIAEKIVKYVGDASTMTVETRFVDTSGPTVVFDNAKAAARTEIRLDGDCSTILPAQPNPQGVMSVDADLFEMHQRAVATAIDYRARILNSLMQVLRQTLPGG